MKTYTVSLAFDVACYTTQEVEAESVADLRQRVIPLMFAEGDFSFDYNVTSDYRICEAKCEDEIVIYQEDFETPDL